MNYKKLGNLCTKVSEICFGALPMGPLQKNIPVNEGQKLLVYALRNGINFIDTAQLYRTYEPIGRALREVDKRPVIATKSTAKSYAEMKEAYLEASDLMGLQVIDIFHLHAARVNDTVFEEREGALEFLKEYKQKDKIKAIGVSSHSVSVVNRAASLPEIDIVFPIINKKGMGIVDGSIQEMEEAIARCVKNNKGIYLMKVLAGGNLIGDYEEAISYARAIPGISSIAIGMVSKEEVDYNLAYFNGKSAKDLPSVKDLKKRMTIVQVLCKGCSTCIKACPNKAIEMIENKARINMDSCLTCGYCVKECSEFAIRMI